MRPTDMEKNKAEASSTSRRCGAVSPERTCDDSPPIDSKGSSAGNTSPSLADDPGTPNPLEVSALSNENDGEVGMLCSVHVTGMTDHLSRMSRILEIVKPMEIPLMEETIQRE
jgi:hypothetical protein